jgi:hypothetical protein
MRMELEDVIGSLRDVLKRAKLDGETHYAALDTTSSLARPTHLAELLRSLHADEQASAKCAMKSYPHPLGFQNLLLIEEASLFDLRLHVWWPGTSSSLDHVHNHRLAFTSAAVLGGYNMKLFETNTEGALVREYRETTTPNEGWQLTPVGAAHLRLLTTVKLEPGASYALAADALHLVAVPPGKLCITLLFRSHLSRRTTTRVFTQPGREVCARIPVQALSSAEYGRQLMALLSELGD